MTTIERVIRPVAFGRKSWLLAASAPGLLGAWVVLSEIGTDMHRFPWPGTGCPGRASARVTTKAPVRAPAQRRALAVRTRVAGETFHDLRQLA